MIRKFYFRDWTEQITYWYEETMNVLRYSEKEIDHMEKLDKENKDLSIKKEKWKN